MVPQRKFVVIPKRFKIEVEFASEEGAETTTSTHWIYFRGEGCPVPVVIETERVYAEYESRYPTANDRQNLSDEEYLAKAREANLLLYRDLLVNCSDPNIDPNIANFMIGTSDTNSYGMQILEEAGWYRAVTIDPNALVEETTTENEKEGEGETGDLQ